jgi:hypothetical protein
MSQSNENIDDDELLITTVAATVASTVTAAVAASSSKTQHIESNTTFLYENIHKLFRHDTGNLVTNQSEMIKNFIINLSNQDEQKKSDELPSIDALINLTNESKEEDSKDTSFNSKVSDEKTKSQFKVIKEYLRDLNKEKKMFGGFTSQVEKLKLSIMKKINLLQ